MVLDVYFEQIWVHGWSWTRPSWINLLSWSKSVSKYERYSFPVPWFAQDLTWKQLCTSTFNYCNFLTFVASTVAGLMKHIFSIDLLLSQTIRRLDQVMGKTFSDFINWHSVLAASTVIWSRTCLGSSKTAPLKSAFWRTGKLQLAILSS